MAFFLLQCRLLFQYKNLQSVLENLSRFPSVSEIFLLGLKYHCHVSLQREIYGGKFKKIILPLKVWDHRQRRHLLFVLCIRLQNL